MVGGGTEGETSGSKDLEGYRERRYAMRPEAWAAAIEVPEMVLLAVLLPIQVERIVRPKM